MNEFEPSIKVIMIKIGLTVGLAIATLSLFALNPGLVGGGDLANILLAVAAFIFALAILRLFIKAVILSKTTYIVTPSKLRLEYSLLYKSRTREIPLKQLRGMELKQDRVQAALGFGTLVFLTGGMNQSLGFIEFENIEGADNVRDRIRAQRN